MSARRRDRGEHDRRPRYALRRTIVGGAAGVMLIVVAYLVAAAIAPIAPVRGVTTTYAAPDPAATALQFPDYGATAVAAEGFPDSLRTAGDTAPRSIASISKIVTALVVLDRHPLTVNDPGPTITFTPAMSALYATYLAQDGEVAPMPVGLQLTERQAFDVMLMKSANNYAGALALWTFGSMTAYAQAASAFLQAHGLTHTTIHEPTGLNPANQSTATDLVQLGELALTNPVVKTIVSTKTADIPTVGTVTNSNKLLGIDGVDGIKTGTLGQAGACLLFASTTVHDGRPVTVVGAMLGGTDHTALDADVQRLLHSVTDNFRTITLAKKGQPFGSYRTAWQGTVPAVAARTERVLVWGRTDVHAATRLASIRSGAPGTTVGTVRFAVSGQADTQVPLILGQRVSPPALWWRWSNPFAAA
ncbi:D-alanyl-D-alanine carboxypeptidase family protein [Curtobacterium ammoniigenes]|uniref:D-alanyl-D-alanine carboxypeptidase family protein n=1 Tax=Curtobacterium ammoniigenes TaxID=395387 RepID=UPI000A409D6B|nr:D-alanyl-D-alanine carboxypeptidase [Curtobacterium ammoniigenes]